MNENRWLRIYEQRVNNMVGELRVCEATRDYSRINLFELIRIIETAIAEIKSLQKENSKIKAGENDVLDNLCAEFLNYVLKTELKTTIDEFDKLINKESENGN